MLVSLKNPDDAIVANKSMFILSQKFIRLKVSQGSAAVLKMENYEEATRVKLTNAQLNQLKSPVKNKTGTT